ncbi:MAG TPA: hypothetical protein VKA30_12525 [Actinomycetota bacterium]|nr:hypothetical protein [Actinomycetota bacterium]
MSEQDEPQDTDRDDQQKDEGGDKDEQRERAFDLTDPVPEPGVTAPLHHVTEEEEKSGPLGARPDEESSNDDQGQSDQESSNDDQGEGDGS